MNGIIIKQTDHNPQGNIIKKNYKTIPELTKQHVIEGIEHVVITQKHSLNK